MAKLFLVLTLSILLLALTINLTYSTRILDDVTSDADGLPPLPSAEDPPSGLPGADAPTGDDEQAPSVQPNPDDDADAPASGGSTPGTTQGAGTTSTVSGRSSGTPQGSGTTSTVSGGTTGTTQGGSSSGTVADGTEHPAISFYMHDVLGGSHASGRIVTGLIASQNVNGIPFSRPNSQVFPVSNGVPLGNNNLNNLFNNNNVPFVAGLNGQNQQQSAVISNTGSNNVVNNGNNNNQAFVTPGQLPSGVSLQKLMFGSITVIDDELTEGPELGSGVIGQGQGFYLASSLDGESHTMAFTTLFHGDHDDHEDDTISFFGVHRTASPISHIAIVGGTGKYENAKGYATIEALPQQNQHTTDGVDTIAHISVYTSY
ncbi:hypothetical protein RND81_03G104300 [Saponaria officinalis]|uniref:Dirigent protein n=1 Tax=Saponaria officinalis TaxID=3572 RepID=A0AAW1M7M7_SAPOF